jgi:hypothetical protein
MPRVKKVVEEPECCSVCLDNYTPIIRKKCVCRYCKADTCSKCIERYLLDRHEDAHCLHCRVNYNDTTLREICTRTYLQQTYFKHRQEVLINRERANLPGLQEIAITEKKNREIKIKQNIINMEIRAIHSEREMLMVQYNYLYADYYKKLAAKEDITELRKQMDDLLAKSAALGDTIAKKNDEYARVRWPNGRHYENGRWVDGDGAEVPESPVEEKKKFIRRCTRSECQGFLSTAWKCEMCEYYSCNKCFKTKTKKHDDPHECVKEDLETAELIKKDCKPCPNCGEFIMRSQGCSQMFCISCKTPWDWNTGKVVTSGIIHNPHYYEWQRRNGNAAPRNPADVPCGGFPNYWELVRMPKGLKNSIADRYFEFHRMCQELQDISERSYRSHIDNDSTTNINVRFLVGDYDEKHWGQLLGKNERKRKRDSEVQEVFAAFRMVAVELLNRVQNYRSEDGLITRFTDLPVAEAERFLTALDVEIAALITMINDALRNVSIGYSYVVPYITIEDRYYIIKTKNFSSEVKKKRGQANASVAGGGGGNDEKDDSDDEDEVVEDKKENIVIEPSVSASLSATLMPSVSASNETTTKPVRRKRPVVAPSTTEEAVKEILDEDTQLQAAIEASFAK